MRCRVVPAIDLIDGRCVRLRKGDFSTAEVVAEDPLETARWFAAEGFTRLHLVDLSGAKAGAPQHLAIAKAIAALGTLEVDYSGGLRTLESVTAALDAGIRYIVIGSAAIQQRPEVQRWIQLFGPERFILAFDVLAGSIRVSGWQEDTEILLEQAIESYLDLGVTRVISTDIASDGELAGPAVELYQQLRTRFPTLSLIASGGVSTPQDVRSLASLGVSEVIVGRALYSGHIRSEEITEFVW